MNTREYRTRKKLEEERHNAITRMQKINPEFKPPTDYRYVDEIVKKSQGGEEGTLGYSLH